MVETTLPDGLETSGWRVYRWLWHISRRLWVFLFWIIFLFFFCFFLVFVYFWSTLLWYRCYYPHWSRDSMSPLCRIFKSSFYIVLLGGLLMDKDKRGFPKTALFWCFHIVVLGGLLMDKDKRGFTKTALFWCFSAKGNVDGKIYFCPFIYNCWEFQHY